MKKIRKIAGIWKRRSIRKRLILTMGMLVLLSIGLCTLILSIYWSREKFRTFDQYSGEIVRQISKSVNASLQNLDKLAVSIAYSNNIQDVIQENYSVYPDLYAANRKETGWYLMNMKNAYSGITSIHVYDMEGNLFSTPMIFRNLEYRLEDEPWLDEFLSSDEISRVIGPRLNMQETYPEDEIVSVVRKIRSLKTMEDAGIIFINVRMEDLLDNSLQNIWNADNGFLLIVTMENRTVFDSGNLFPEGEGIDRGWFRSLEQTEGTFDYTYQGRAYHMMAERCDNGWFVCRGVETANLYMSIRGMLLLSVAVSVVVILLTLFFIFVFADNFVKPILRIQKSMQRLAANNFDFYAEGEMEEVRSYEMEEEDEIGVLIKSYNEMAGELHSMTLAVYQTEEEKHRLEMEALFTQINPHFTYNTLNTIKQMAILQNAKGIADMTDAIVNLLRATAKYGDGTSSLEKELRLLEDYIYIMKMRYYDDFAFVIDTEPGLETAAIPCMLLQPLVENALLHGLFGVEREGVIEIVSRKENGNLILTVSDNGKGVDMEYVEALLRGGKRIKKGDYGVGIYNVHRRIQLRYGMEYGLRFEKRVPCGTRVTIKIPLEGEKTNVQSIDCG